MTLTIAGLRAVEVLDSRGRPTLAVTSSLPDGTSVRAGVPSGRPPAAGRRPRTRSSRTWPPAQAPVSSRPAPRRAASGSPSTTGSSRSRPAAPLPTGSIG